LPIGYLRSEVFVAPIDEEEELKVGDLVEVFGLSGSHLSHTRALEGLKGTVVNISPGRTWSRNYQVRFFKNVHNKQMKHFHRCNLRKTDCILEAVAEAVVRTK
jgi:hypothetical protein